VVIQAANPHPQLLPSLLHYALDTPSIASNLTTETYGTLLREPIRAANIDHLTLLLYEIRARGTELPVGRAGQIISIAAEHGLVRLALDLARHEEGEYGSDLETQVWVDILRTSADRYFVSWRSIARLTFCVSTVLTRSPYLFRSTASRLHGTGWFEPANSTRTRVSVPS
jgi:hypothetical protein